MSKMLCFITPVWGCISKHCSSLNTCLKNALIPLKCTQIWSSCPSCVTNETFLPMHTQHTHSVFIQVKPTTWAVIHNHNTTNHDAKLPLCQKNNTAAEHMESKIQAHTVSSPLTRLPLTTFPLSCDFKKVFTLFTLHLFGGSEWRSVVLGHLSLRKSRGGGNEGGWEEMRVHTHTSAKPKLHFSSPAEHSLSAKTTREYTHWNIYVF